MYYFLTLVSRWLTFALRFTSTGVGLTCALYDHVLTFNDEWKYKWTRGGWDLSRMIFFLIRYCNEAGLLCAAYGEYHCEKL